MGTRTKWLTVALLLAGGAVAGNGSAGRREANGSLAQEATPPTSEIRRLFDEDQKDRENMLRFKPDELEAVNRRDAQRRQRTRELLAAEALTSGQDFRYAAFIFQHGDTADDILMAHVLAVVALSKGDARSRGIAAATLDRYLHRIQQPQIFGTQYMTNQGTWDPAKQWTQEPFNRDLLPQSLRREMCIPNMAQQTDMLDALNKGTPMHPPRVCP